MYPYVSEGRQVPLVLISSVATLASDVVPVATLEIRMLSKLMSNNINYHRKLT